MYFEQAKIEDITPITSYVESELEKLDCPMRDLMQISIAIDEIYSNIVFYAYGEGSGPATVIFEELNDPHGMQLTFIDEGQQYDPLAKEDPDITLKAEERGVGGLGIYMVKNQMSNMLYEYKDGKNILTIQKFF